MVVPGTAANPPAPAEVAVHAPHHLSYNPLDYWSNYTKVLLLTLATLSTVICVILVSASRQNPDVFITGQLAPVQVAAFLVCFGAIMWYVALRVAVWRDSFGSDDPAAAAVAHRRYISDETKAYVDAAGEFCAYLLLFYLCDRTTFFGRASKKFDRDLFWFLWALLMLAAFATLHRAKPEKPASATPAIAAAATHDHPPAAAGEGTTAVPAPPMTTALVASPADPEDYHIKHLQRDQTEEWKGWMQIMFLWYHYFEAKELYNVIRLYIAAYVWMTGFGNFSYYYIKRDFSFSRFMAMQWRLNFFVLCVCATLNNEYMLYYICMLHTTFTVFIYAGLGIFSQMNYTAVGVATKLIVFTAICAFIWDLPGVFEWVWAPVTYLVQFHNPYNVKEPIMHEWKFRSFLDHFVWIFGMLWAYNHPRIDSWLQTIDTLPRWTSRAAKGTITLVCLGVGYWYVEAVFSLPKLEYNKLHPYTSFIPIMLYCVLRNLSARLRQYHLHLFEYLGKITLETYISQFHIWMVTTGNNGSPKKLLRVLPEGWPLLNFLIVSALCLWVSLRLFHTSNVLKNVMLPNKATNAVLIRNLVWAVIGIVGLYSYSHALVSLNRRLSE